MSPDTEPPPPPGKPMPLPALRKRRLLLGGVAGTAALAGMGLAMCRLPDPAKPGDSAGSADLATLWALRVDQPQGGELALTSLRGKPLLINFWATWCAPCLREMPEIDRFHREFSARGWQVLGLAIDGPTPVREFLARVKIGFPIGLAGLDGTDLLHTLGNSQGGLPFSVMISAGGQVMHRKMGATSYEELAGWVAKV